MTDEISQRLASYNSKRHFKDAAMMYPSVAVSEDAHLHYQGALAFMMLGQPADKPIERLKACPNYTPEMEGDLHRDIALRFIREGDNLKEAERHIRLALELHGSIDRPRYAVNLQAQCRLLEARGELWEAYTGIQEAVNLLWNNAKPINQVWLANTAFHAARIAVKVRQRRYARFMAYLVVRYDTSWRKRWGARLIAHLPGDLGVRLTSKLR